MPSKIRLITEPKRTRPIPPLRVTCYRIVKPWHIEAQPEEIRSVPAGCVLLRPLTTGICHADLRYLSGTRPPEVLGERLPMAPFHEGVAEIMELGPEVVDFRVGQAVVVVPNIPCYVHDPWRYPSKDQSCAACSPGGVGENFCADARFLASNVDGMARSAFLHPVAALQPKPEELPDLLATLAEPLSVTYAAVEPLAPSPTDHIAVLGAGVMGFLVVLTLSRFWNVPRERLIATDLLEARLAEVQDMAQTLKSPDERALDKLDEEFDIVFECAGGKAAHATLEQAIKLLKPGGRCMLVGVSEEPVPVRTRRMLDKGLTLRGTTRSAYAHFTPALRKLADPEFQALARRILHPKLFPGHSVQSILAAARAAAAPEWPGKVIINWTEKGTAA